MHPSPANAPSAAQQRLRDAAQQVLDYLNNPKGQSSADVAHALDKVLGRWLDRYFMRHGVPEAQAEGLTMEVWVKLLKGGHAPRSNAFALVCRVARHQLIDHIRAQQALKNRAHGQPRAAQAETQLDEELWDLVQNTTPSPHHDLELRDCIQKKMHLFSQQHPARAQLIEYLWDGLSYLEIATLVFGDQALRDSKTFVARIRNRVEEARKQAKQVFQECWS